MRPLGGRGYLDLPISPRMNKNEHNKIFCPSLEKNKYKTLKIGYVFASTVTNPYVLSSLKKVSYLLLLKI